MNRYSTIRPVLALLMLCLFAFSVTPRKTLHDLLGCHPGSKKAVLRHAGESLGSGTFNCSCDQPELHAPFIEYPEFTGIATPASFQNRYVIPYCTPLCESAKVFSKLRGPPATA